MKEQDGTIVLIISIFFTVYMTIMALINAKERSDLINNKYCVSSISVTPVQDVK